MKRSTLLAGGLAAAVLLLAACSGGAATTTTTGGSTTTAAAGSRFDVTMETFAFTPEVLTVPVGATVTWTNHHGSRHNVVADDGTFSSPLFGQDETFSFTFTAPGEYHYVCSIHPGMEGTIVVTP